jgi:hypothetical protein
MIEQNISVVSQSFRCQMMEQRCRKVAQELEDQDLEANETNMHILFSWRQLIVDVDSYCSLMLTSYVFTQP